MTIKWRVRPRPTEAGNRETRMIRHRLEMHIARKKGQPSDNQQRPKQAMISYTKLEIRIST